MNNVDSVQNGDVVDGEDKWEVRYKPIYKFTREEIGKALLKNGDTRTALRFMSCRRQYHVHQCGKCEHIEISGSRCENRLCPECGEKKKGRLIAQNIEFLDRLPSNPRGQKKTMLLTLTVRNVPDSEYSRKHYVALTNHLREFLNHPRIKGRIRGGIYSIETKRPPKGYVYYRKGIPQKQVAPGRTWNLHVHALVDADYIPWQVARGVWKGVTAGGLFDGSFDVDLRAVFNTVPALVEVIKYVCKAPNLGDADSYARYLDVTKGLRQYNTFGTFRGHFKKGEKPKKKCPRCKNNMRYFFDIGPHEALRYRQYLMGGPPVDAFGYRNVVGLPESINRLLSAGPFFNATKKIRSDA